MSEFSSQHSPRLENPISYPLTDGAGIAVARLRALRERQRAVDEALAVAWRPLSRLLARTQAALEESRQRRLALRDLRALDDHLLADIGLSRPLLDVVASDLVRSGACSGARPDERDGRCGRPRTARRGGPGHRLTTCPAS